MHMIAQLRTFRRTSSSGPGEVETLTSLDLVAITYVGGRDEHREFLKQFGAFQSLHGQAVESYFCLGVPAAVVLTRSDTGRHSDYELHLVFPHHQAMPAWLVKLL